MGLKDDLEREVATIFKDQWSTRKGTVVPSESNIALGNDAVKLQATVLYADIADSTQLVSGRADFVAAEIYKAFLHCAAKIIRSESGVITAYDGDRIMAVYIGDSKNTSAVRSALKLHHAVAFILNPAQKIAYDSSYAPLKHVVGIDTSDLFVARTGVRGANDLVWVGRAANHAAKLATLPELYPTYISTDIYNNIHESVKTSNGKEMWEAVRWNTFDDRIIYRSNYRWVIE